MCQTSETTVLRFCRAIGLAGYPELRIALARAAQWEETEHGTGAPLNGDISPTDSLADVVAKITHADARAIEDTAATLDLDVLQKAVDAVVAGAPDRHLRHRGERSGRRRTCTRSCTGSAWSRSSGPTAHLALTSAAVLRAGDVAVGISHTGTTIDTVDALRVARERGATTIAITNFAGSPIAAEADLLLTTAARETTFRSGAMSSRIAQLAVVDCLFAGVAQHSYDPAIDALQSTHAVVRTRHGAGTDRT